MGIGKSTLLKILQEEVTLTIYPVTLTALPKTWVTCFYPTSMARTSVYRSYPMSSLVYT